MWKYNDELYHWGIPGMKWGFRKSKNSSSSSKKKTSRAKGSADHQLVTKLRKKKMRDLSNEELKTINNRKQLERTNKQLTPGKIALGATLAVGAVVALSKYGEHSKKIRGSIKALKVDGKSIVNGMKNIKNLRLPKVR